MDEAQIHSLYMSVFENPNGQLVLEDLRQRCFANAPTIGKDAFETYSNEGKRSVLLHILTMLKPIEAKEKV